MSEVGHTPSPPWTRGEAEARRLNTVYEADRRRWVRDHPPIAVCVPYRSDRPAAKTEPLDALPPGEWIWLHVRRRSGSFLTLSRLAYGDRRA